jgi:hypothetical protein
MKKPVSKLINGTLYHARKFSLAAVNEIRQASLTAMYGGATLSRADMKSFAKDGASVEEIGLSVEDHLKMQIVPVLMKESVALSLRLKHSLCDADGILIYKSVAQMEQVLDPDDVEELEALVNAANPVKTVAAELEDAEKN